MKLKLYYLVSILSLLYLAYYIFIKVLLNYFNLQEIIVHLYLLTGIIVLIFFKNDLYTSIKKINFNYIYLILLAFVLVITNIFAIIACDSNINFGIIDSLASSIYLPIVALISFYFFNAQINYINFIGVIVVAIGAFLINY